MDNLFNCIEIEDESWQTPGQGQSSEAGERHEVVRELTCAVLDRSYSRAYALLRRIDREHIAMDDADKKLVLLSAIFCTLRLFQTIYEQLFPDGTDETMQFSNDMGLLRWRISEMSPFWGCQVEGSLLLIAAANDRPEHVRYLLSKGYNANGVPPHEQDPTLPTQTIFFIQDAKGIAIPDCTPLAAAIFFGAVHTVDLFTQRSDVQREEAPSVCRAVASVLCRCEKMDELHEMCINSAFPEYCLSRLSGETAEFPHLPLDVIADVCAPEFFAQQIRAWPRSEEEALSALEVLSGAWTRDVLVGEWTWERDAEEMVQKLLPLAPLFQTPCREAWVSGIYLAALCCCGIRDAAFTACCLPLLGDTVDLTWACRALFTMKEKEAAELLRALNGRRLTINADAFAHVAIGSAEGVYWLLDNVEIEPSCFSDGLSVLAERIMCESWDVRRLRPERILELLRREPRGALVKALDQNRNTLIRAAALIACATAQPRKGDQAKQTEYDRFNRLGETLCRWHEEAQNSLRQQKTDPLPESWW